MNKDTKICINLNGNSKMSIIEQSNNLLDILDKFNNELYRSDIFHGRNSMNRKHLEDMLEVRFEILNKVKLIKDTLLNYTDLEKLEQNI